MTPLGGSNNMPKKTKKQKILAQLHRKLQLATQMKTGNFQLSSDFVKSQNVKLLPDQKSLAQTSVSFINETVIKPKNDNLASSYDYVKKDLVKITIFTLFAVALQGMLYFLLRTR